MTSALDVSVQAAVLKLLQDLKNDMGTTYIFVSHDLAVVRAISDKVAVLYQGRLCEFGPSSEFINFLSPIYRSFAWCGFRARSRFEACVDS